VKTQTLFFVFLTGLFSFSFVVPASADGVEYNEGIMAVSDCNEGPTRRQIISNPGHLKAYDVCYMVANDTGTDGFIICNDPREVRDICRRGVKFYGIRDQKGNLNFSLCNR